MLEIVELETPTQVAAGNHGSHTDLSSEALSSENGDPEALCSENGDPEALCSEKGDLESLCSENGDPEALCSENGDPEALCSENSENGDPEALSSEKRDRNIVKSLGIRKSPALSSEVIQIFPKTKINIGLIFQKAKINLNPKGPSGNMFFLICCMIAISLDPLFFYIPVINDEKQCLHLDSKLGITTSAVRSVFDLFYGIYIAFRLRDDFFIPLMTCRGSDEGDESRLEIAKEYLLGFFLVDILTILPLPQIVTWMMIQTKGGPKFLTVLKFFVFFQYVPRLFRIYPLTSDGLADTRWVKVMFNLLLYVLVSHVFGAFWYFLAIERMAACWKRACINSAQCNPSSSFYCNDSREDRTFVNDFCPVTTPNTTIFDFGIFHDALRSGIVESTDFLQKSVHCFQWSLQNLSGFGQNLQPSTYIWEKLFVILITVSGLVLFVLLIGNIQTYLQSQIVRKEEMRLKTQEIAQDVEQWMSRKGLPKNLKQEVRKHKYVFQKLKGFDVENFLNNLPKHLQRLIKCKLFLELLKRVHKLHWIQESMLIKLCERAKPVHYIDRTVIFHEGDPLDEMLIIVQGKVQMYTKNKRKIRGEGKVVGEKLFRRKATGFLTWTYTVQALEEVEAVALKADDLRNAYKSVDVCCSKHSYCRRCTLFEMMIRMFLPIKGAACFCINLVSKKGRGQKNPSDSVVMSS